MKRKRIFFFKATENRIVEDGPQADDKDATQRVETRPSLSDMTIAADATERVTRRASASDLTAASDATQDMISREPADATQRVPWRTPVSDMTERIALHTADENATGKIVIRKSHADATERVAPHSLARLYARAVAREAEATGKSETDEEHEGQGLEPSDHQTPCQDATMLHDQRSSSHSRDGCLSASSGPSRPSDLRTISEVARPSPTHRKRTRRGLFAALRLVADILLVLMLILVSVGLYQQHVQAQQALSMPQVQRQAEQAQANVARQLAAQQLAQAQQQALALVQQFHKEALDWGNAHLYHDSFDKHDYALDSGYMQPGIGALIDKDLSEARTTDDFAAVVGETNYALFNLHMLEADYADHMPFNQPHASDLNMLAQYHLQGRTVMVVSLVEQVMRVYQQGKLVRSMLVTTGRFERPSLPGVWSSLNRQAPTVFVSGDPKGSPYWFPPTNISYAILYHLGGFFVHDAPWRGTFGPGTQFPHQDARGNTAYNFDGSHGCVNLSEVDANWVYHNTDFNTAIVIY